MCDKQESLFPKLFLAYFNSSLTIQQKLIAQTQSEGSGRWLPFVIDLQIDLMDISGIAMILSDIDKTRFGQMVAKLWDIHLTDAPDPSIMVKAWLSSIDSAHSVPIFSPSSMQRSKWTDRLGRALVDRGIETDEIYGFSPLISDDTDARSPLIRALGFHLGHPSRHPYEIFGAMYIAKLELAKGLELPYPIRSCVRDLQDEEGV